ncbi:MAG: hypothetical protein AAGI01_19085, partial [Myxococcota bacterium]
MRRFLPLLSALGLAVCIAWPRASFAQSTPPVTVEVRKGGPDGEALAGAPVFLRAARPKGPFEPTDPEPVREWTMVTDADGRAIFRDVPSALAAQGLRLHAVAQYEGELFKSSAVTPTPGVKLTVPVFERTFDTSLIQVASVRTVVQIAERYLVFGQTWTLTIEGNAALDTTLVPDASFEKGLPLELPLKATGINTQGGGGGALKTVNSTVFWKGVLKPGEPVNIQIRYSIPVKRETYVYEQDFAYPVRRVEFIVPVQTPFSKVPYLDGLELRSNELRPGSPEDVAGLRTDQSFIISLADDVPPGQKIRLQIKNLPFTRPLGPWVALALGLLGAVAILVFAASERREYIAQESMASFLETLAVERDVLFDELADLQ